MGRREKTKAKNANGVKILIIILVLLLIVAGVLFALKALKKGQVEQVNNGEVQQEEKEQPKLKIVNQNSKSRPYAVMINNNHAAWPQCGIGDAYIVYEIVAEGGITRMMALYKDQDTAKIGSIRSARHYFIDYAMENDAIYVHFGQSPQAASDIKKYSINDINGISEDGSTFWRVKDKTAPHNAVTSMANLKKSAESKKFKTTSTEKSVLNYVTDEVNLEDGESAETITIPHSQLQTVKYEYDSENKVYKRYARGVAQKDWDTKDAITIKNLIITYCDNYTLTDTENKGRQGLKNIGTFDGYYITNGKAIKIKCIKEARDSKTIYQDLQGNVIKVNDGNTFVNICPTDAKVTIEGTDLVTNTETN